MTWHDVSTEGSVRETLEPPRLVSALQNLHLWSVFMGAALTKISSFTPPVCLGVAGSWRLWLQRCAQAAAALGETPRRPGQHIPRVKVQGGWMRTRRADPPSGLPVLPGRWGAVLRPRHGGGGAGEAGEGADGSTHTGPHPRAAPQPFASETHRWESQHNSRFLITSRSLPRLPGGWKMEQTSG